MIRPYAGVKELRTKRRQLLLGGRAAKTHDSGGFGPQPRAGRAQQDFDHAVMVCGHRNCELGRGPEAEDISADSTTGKASPI